jgi:hypothetical protein
MISPDKIAHARAQGVVFTCATCEKFWRAVDMGLNECRPLTPTPCSGPLKGRDYPHYEGVLSGNLHHACFVCGDKPTGALRPKGGQLIGVCEKHKEALFDFSGKVDGRPETADKLEVEERD